ncbi:hypothetical protein ACFX13_031512 [Malus domestica]|uniref:C2H2-type domain-containing protein n=1 Tax=Malus domestica TaxID=3750 RepID=A0A498K4A0_MALDO|nr:hypothetical protein DVH24_003157 [Malus domestica]
MAFPRNNNGSSNITTSSQNPNLIPTLQRSNVYTNLQMPISNRYSYVNSPLVHTQRAQYQPPLAGVANWPGVRPFQQNMHVLQTSSSINANAYRVLNPIMSRASTRPRLPSFSSNINIGRPTFMSNQAQVQPTITRATSPTTPNFVPTPVFPRIPPNPQAPSISSNHSGPSHVVRELNTTTVATAVVPTTTTTTIASQPQPRPQTQAQPQWEHKFSQCDKKNSTRSALGGHMSFHSRKRKLEEETSRGRRFHPLGYSSFFPLVNDLAFESGSSSCFRANPTTVSASGLSDPSTSIRSENAGIEGTEAPLIKREEDEDEKGPS